ncbi:methyltransferase domain-containing protein [Thermoproteota archaeon]
MQKLLSDIEQLIARFPSIYRFLKRRKVQYQRTKYKVFKLFGKDKDIIYNGSFFDKNLKMNMPIASRMVNVLVSHFNPKSVVDVGCGNAEFLSCFQKKGVEVKGYEGSAHAIARCVIDKRLVEKFDLRNHIDSNRTYDLAMCLEVAEHIEKIFSAKLVENLVGLSSIVVFTAAPPGQGGHFHINEQPREFWFNLFRSKGFEFDAGMTEKIKNDFKEKDVLWWYSANLMIFIKRNSSKH